LADQVDFQSKEVEHHNLREVVATEVVRTYLQGLTLLAVVVLYLVAAEAVGLPCSQSGMANQDEDLTDTVLAGNLLVEDQQEGTHNQKWVDSHCA